MSSTYIAWAQTRTPYPYSRVFKRSARTIGFSKALLRLEQHKTAVVSAHRSHINKKQTSISHLFINIQCSSSNAHFLLVLLRISSLWALAVCLSSSPLRPRLQNIAVFRSHSSVMDKKGSVSRMSSSEYIAETQARASYSYSKGFSGSTFENCLFFSALRLESDKARSFSAHRSHINKKADQKVASLLQPLQKLLINRIGPFEAGY